LARQHVTVALSGDGGDELFAGYERYGRNLRQSGFVPEWLGRWYRQHAHPLIPRSARGRHLVFNRTLPPHERYLDQLAYLPALDREQSLFTADFLALARRCPNPFDPYRCLLSKAPASDRVSQLLYLDAKTYLPGDILTKVDRMSMLCSLEARVPLLDHIFLEWVTRLPARWKFRGSSQKYIFKKLAERLGIPPQVIYRPKQGFALPLVHWMRLELRDELLRLLLEPRAVARGYLNPRGVKVLLDEHLRGRRDNSGTLWQLLIFELWHRNFLEAQSSAEPSSPSSDLPVVHPRVGAEPESVSIQSVNSTATRDTCHSEPSEESLHSSSGNTRKCRDASRRLP
jgi:asparagine synthase (glutamine-hydrolysing)